MSEHVYRFAAPEDALAAIPAWQRVSWKRQIERARSGPDWSDLVERALVAADDYPSPATEAALQIAFEEERKNNHKLAAE